MKWYFKIVLSIILLNFIRFSDSKAQVIDYEFKQYDIVNDSFFDFLEHSIDSLLNNPFVRGVFRNTKDKEQPKSQQSNSNEFQYYFEMHWFYDSISKNSNLIFFISPQFVTEYRASMNVNSYCKINEHVIVFDSINMMPLLTYFEKSISVQNIFKITNKETHVNTAFDEEDLFDYIHFIQFYKAYYLILFCDFCH